MNQKPHIVIVGGGFAGIEAAKALGSGYVRVTLIDRYNHHLFQPLLYQVATAGLSPGEIAAPLRAVFRDSPHIEVMWREVTGVDSENKKVLMGEESLSYDSLIIATGSEYNYFGNEQWKEFAPNLKTLRDATLIREKILVSLEKAESSTDPVERKRLLSFVMIGGGPTGVELAGAVAELVRLSLSREYRKIDEKEVRILLIEAQKSILSSFPEPLSNRALQDLRDLGVEVRLETKVVSIEKQRVVTDGEDIASDNIVWAAGVRPTPVAQWLGVKADRGGRVPVDGFLQAVGVNDVYVIGDASGTFDDKGMPLPALAPVAIQQGKYVGKRLNRIIDGRDDSREFRYWDKGSLATIGRSKAIALIGPFRLSGFAAWLTWLFVHLMYLVGFENRLLVFVQWAWYYFTFKRSIRLITERSKWESKANLKETKSGS